MRRVAHVDAHVGHAIECFDGLSDGAYERRIVGRAQQKCEPDFAIGGGSDITHHFGGHDVGAGAWIAHVGEDAGDTLLKGLHVSWSVRGLERALAGTTGKRLAVVGER